MDINELTIWCTKDQIEKLLELNTNIEKKDYAFILQFLSITAEQMFNFLEEKGIIEIDVFRSAKNGKKMYSFDIIISEDNLLGDKILGDNGFYGSRKDATLAAIDVALLYLRELKD